MGKAFRILQQKKGLVTDDIYTLLEDRNGNLWIANEGGGISKYEPPRDGHIAMFTSFTDKEGLTGKSIWSILEDKSGNLWFGIQGGGVSKYMGSQFTHYTESNGIRNAAEIIVILEDASGDLWFGSLFEGVTKYKSSKGGQGGSFTQYSQNEGLSSNQIHSILQDRNGNLWFGTAGGVCKYDGKQFTHYTETDGLSNNYVTSILEDHTGNLWFGTAGGGVCKYDGKQFTHYTETDGLSHNVIQSMLQDKNGNIWFGTSFGLSILEPVKTNPSSKAEVLFSSLTYDDGFLGVGCNRSAIVEDKNGVIWIGTSGMVTALYPEALTPDTVVPSMQLMGIKLFNETLPWQPMENNKDTSILLGNGERVHDVHFYSLGKWYGLPENLSLPHNNNFLTFRYIGVTQRSPQKVKYQYILEGNDNHWSALTSSNEATYGNLSHGSYTFKVKAMNSGGYWSDEFQYPFKIRPPWWLTWWAYGLYGLAFVFVFIQVHKYQKARTLRTERERTQQRELAQAKEIEIAYTQLKATQAQLIQSEKMASLWRTHGWNST